VTQTKRFKVLLAAAAVVAVAIGCSTTKDTENLLSSAGFKAVPADTPERVAHLKSLPSDKISATQRNGTLYYVFPDPKQNMLYVGQEAEYQKYRSLRRQKQMVDEQAKATATKENAWAVWGPWWPGGTP
jgi:hypothetical protein